MLFRSVFCAFCASIPPHEAIDWRVRLCNVRRQSEQGSWLHDTARTRNPGLQSIFGFRGHHNGSAVPQPSPESDFAGPDPQSAFGPVPCFFACTFLRDLSSFGSDHIWKHRFEPFRNQRQQAYQTQANQIVAYRGYPNCSTSRNSLEIILTKTLFSPYWPGLTRAIHAKQSKFKLVGVPMKQKRRLAICTLSSLFTAVAAFSSGPLHAQDGLDFNEAERMMSFNTVELKDQLYFGLRIFLPEQQAFVNDIVARVEAGELPRSMVNVVFVWSRKRRPKIPFPYFEIAMRLLAEKRGVILP